MKKYKKIPKSAKIEIDYHDKKPSSVSVDGTLDGILTALCLVCNNLFERDVPIDLVEDWFETFFKNAKAYHEGTYEIEIPISKESAKTLKKVFEDLEEGE